MQKVQNPLSTGERGRVLWSVRSDMDGRAAIPPVSCVTSASWKFMLVLKTKLLTFPAGMEVSSEQIRGAQAHLNWQFNSVTVQDLPYEQTASTSGTANPTPFIYSELKTQDFMKDKAKRGCKNTTWQCLPLQTSICEIKIRMPQSQCWFYTKVEWLEMK